MSGEAFGGFSRKALTFLRELSRNNNRDWFEAHRETYENEVLDPARGFVESLGDRMHTVAPGVRYDPRVNGSIFRISRDTRFSKDKTPYKPHLDFWFWRGTGRGRRCPGFFFRLAPRRVVFGAGLHRFEPEVLKAYREAVDSDRRGRALQRVVKKIDGTDGYDIGGQMLKRVPREFESEHPRGDLLRRQGLYAGCEAAAGIVHSKELLDACLERFRVMAPLVAWIFELRDW